MTDGIGAPSTPAKALITQHFTEPPEGDVRLLPGDMWRRPDGSLDKLPSWMRPPTMGPTDTLIPQHVVGTPKGDWRLFPSRSNEVVPVWRELPSWMRPVMMDTGDPARHPAQIGLDKLVRASESTIHAGGGDLEFAKRVISFASRIK